MKIDWENGEWAQGEKPKKKTFKEFYKEKGYLYLVASLIISGIWWWFIGEKWIAGDLSTKLTPPKHLNLRR